MNMQRIVEELRRTADVVERHTPTRGEDIYEGAFITSLPDYPWDSSVLMWCDGFGPHRPWVPGDPLPDQEKADV